MSFSTLDAAHRYTQSWNCKRYFEVISTINDAIQLCVKLTLERPYAATNTFHSYAARVSHKQLNGLVFYPAFALLH